MKKMEKVGSGQTIRTDTGPDRSGHKVNMNEALCGRKMGGGPTDISHSLSGGGSAASKGGGGGKRSKSY